MKNELCIHEHMCTYRLEYVKSNGLKSNVERFLWHEKRQPTDCLPCYDSIIVLYETAAHLLVRHFPIALSAVLQQPLHQQWHRQEDHSG